jgi:hypothetical protein
VRQDLEEVDGAVHLVVELLGVVQLQPVLHRHLLRDWGVGFQVSGKGFRVQDLGFRVYGFLGKGWGLRV